MCASWIQRVGSTIPRGFSRYFILDLLKKKPLSGKEIIDSATKQSEGKWKPSPGLIYPLLGRLLDEGLIEESKDGKYQITRKGKFTADDLLFRIGNVGRFAAMDILERISTMATMLSSNISNMTKEETEKYKKFLQTELRKIDEPEKKKGKDIKIE